MNLIPSPFDIATRAERGVGLAIRKGQAEGTVGSKRKNAGVAGFTSPVKPASPYDFAKHTDLYGDGLEGGNGILAMAEATPEQLDAAKDEGNQSRANVVRLAIRKGQVEGSVGSAQNSNSGPRSDYIRGGAIVRVPVRDSKPISEAGGFFASGTDMTQTYAVTDGVTDEQFDSALTEAKDEGNLSRANVVRWGVATEFGPLCSAPARMRQRQRAARDKYTQTWTKD